MVKINGIEKSYGRKKVIPLMDLEISQGVTGLIGPNGAGKTTLIELISGLRRVSAGKINYYLPSINGKSIISVVLERPSFPKEVTVQKYLQFIAKLPGTLSQIHLSDLLKIKDVLDEKIGNLSAGYLKRLALLVASMQNAKLVIADEPFSNIDPATVDAILSYIRESKSRGVSFLISSHDIRELTLVSDKILMLRNNGTLKLLEPGKDKLSVELIGNDFAALSTFLKANNIENIIDGKRVIAFPKNFNLLYDTLRGYNGSISNIKIQEMDEKIRSEFNSTSNDS
ncbi:putative branched-chain amino acid transport ATP-binding protein LivG [Thermoplasmatales archaeon]|nr:putative branched-chain amino acid transport ATP-binding protein LivG [Thermoplasmatales archaeon]